MSSVVMGRLVVKTNENIRSVRASMRGVRCYVAAPREYGIKSQRQFFDGHIAPQLAISTFEQWYNVKVADVERLGGGNILDRYHDSASGKMGATMQHIYPHFGWNLSEFRGTGARCLSNSKDYQKRKFDKIGQSLRLACLDDWYCVTVKALQDLGAYPIITHKRTTVSLPRTLSTLYPQHDWCEWKFEAGFVDRWRDIQSHKAKFDEMAKVLNVKHIEDWHNVTIAGSVRKAGGLSLLTRKYNGSLWQALRTLYPNCNVTTPRKFMNTTKGSNDGKKRLDMVGKYLGIKELDAWYNVTSTAFSKFTATLDCGHRLHHNTSMFRTLKAIYPTHSWDWQNFNCNFSKRPNNYWRDIENQVQCVKALEKKYEIVTPDMWFQLSSQQTGSLGKGVNSYLTTVLSSLYPKYSWGHLRCTEKRSQQRWLRQCAHSCFA